MTDKKYMHLDRQGVTRDSQNYLISVPNNLFELESPGPFTIHIIIHCVKFSVKNDTALVNQSSRTALAQMPWKI